MSHPASPLLSGTPHSPRVCGGLNEEQAIHSILPHSGSTPKPDEGRNGANQGMDYSSDTPTEERTLRAKADSLWHHGRLGNMDVHADTRPAMTVPRDFSSQPTVPGNDSDTPWQSYFTHSVPFAHNFLDAADPHLRITPSEQQKSQDQLATLGNADMSSWSSSGSVYPTVTMGMPSNAQFYPSHPSHMPLRLDTQLASTPTEENMPSATTMSSYAESGALSRSSTTRTSTSRVTSPSSRTENRSPVSTVDSHAFDYGMIGKRHSMRRQGSESRVRSGSPSTGPPRLVTRGSSPNVIDMGTNSTNNQFSFGVRAKLGTVLPTLIQSIPLDEHNNTVFIAEFGCLNSRSMQLLRPIIDEFAKLVPGSVLAEKQREALSVTKDAVNVNGIATVDSTALSQDPIDFIVIHEDSPQTDFRAFTHILDTHPESYMNPVWQASHKPSLQNAIFSSFVSRPFGSRILPKGTLHFGFSLMDLHWTHTPNAMDVSLATTAQAELTTFLMARAHEFRQGGVFVMAFIARSEPEEANKSSPTNGTTLPAQVEQLKLGEKTAEFAPDAAKTPPPSRDIWATMTEMLVPCLQRLVSCGMLKSAVARQLLTLPLHPRTPSQTMRVLNDLDHLWQLDWSCGAGQENPLCGSTSPESQEGLYSEPNPLRLPQPAWLALQSGRISHAVYTEHLIHMFKNLYESHFRMVLRERGKLSKGAAEFVLDSLWDVLQSRMDDPNSCPLSDCELEVQLIALRRR